MLYRSAPFPLLLSPLVVARTLLACPAAVRLSCRAKRVSQGVQHGIGRRADERRDVEGGQREGAGRDGRGGLERRARPRGRVRRSRSRAGHRRPNRRSRRRRRARASRRGSAGAKTDSASVEEGERPVRGHREGRTSMMSLRPSPPWSATRQSLPHLLTSTRTSARRRPLPRGSSPAPCSAAASDGRTSPPSTPLSARCSASAPNAHASEASSAPVKSGEARADAVSSSSARRGEPAGIDGGGWAGESVELTSRCVSSAGVDGRRCGRKLRRGAGAREPRRQSRRPAQRPKRETEGRTSAGGECRRRRGPTRLCAGPRPGASRGRFGR